MQDPNTHHDSSTYSDDLIKQKERKKRLARLVDEKRVTLFKIYFLILLGLSIFLLISYWPQLTFEERTDSFNLRITNDTMKLHGIEKDLSMTTLSSTERQILLDKKDQLEKEIREYEDALNIIKMKLDGKAPLESNDLFFIGIVKNFTIVILAGTLGGSVSAFRSFNKFLGARKLTMSWNSSYIFRPLQGSVMGLITYILIRSGIYAGMPGVSLDNANLFVVAAGAIVAGLYSDEIYHKFHEVFDTLFKTKTQERDGLEVPPRYPPIVAEIIDNSLVSDSEIVIAFTKDIPLADQRYKNVFESGKRYWMVELKKGKEGVYWVSDETKTIVCQYHM